MKKKMKFTLQILLFALLMLCVSFPVKAKAAAYKPAQTYSKYNSKAARTANGVTFSYSDSSRTLSATKNGKTTKLYKAAKNCGQINSVLTNGSTVYFCERNLNTWKNTFYRVSVTGKSLKRIVVCDNLGSAHFIGYYNGKVYFGSGSAAGDLCSLNVSNGKISHIYGEKQSAEVTNVSYANIGKYIYFNTWGGAIMLYNAGNGKVQKITSTAGTLGLNSPTFATSSSYVYYVKASLKETEDDAYYVASIVRCRPNGTGAKTLVKNLKIGYSGIKTLKTNTVTYYTTSGKLKTKKF